MHLVILLIIFLYKNKCIKNVFKFKKSEARIFVSRCITLYNECSVHGGMFSTSGGVQYIRGYHEYMGGYHEYIRGVFSTSEGYHEDIREIS